MPVFAYSAADDTGRVVEGVLDGESETVALQTLEERDLTPLTIRRASSRKAAASGHATTSSIRLRLDQLLEFTRQLKVMLKSGITLLAALRTLRDSTSTGKFQRMLDRIAADIQRGATLSEALAAHPRTFDAFYIGTVRAGEAAGAHPEAFEELIAYYERRAATKRQLVNALTYPAIVVLTLIGACAVMLTWVVPQFARLFVGMGTALPLPTRILIGTSDFVTGHAVPLGITALGLVVGGVIASRSPAARGFVARCLAHVPIVGSVIRLATVIQFCRMIALLESAGLPLLETLKIVEGALISGPVQRLTGTIRREVAGGNSIAATVGGTRILPKLVEHMINVGETTGNIDELLIAAADHYEELLRVRIRALTTAIEPLMVVVVSGMVLLVALAIFLPIWKMNSMMLGH
ncbi:MAG: type II secretion system F family protein [Phycisphaerae bacterium]|nr:type II secretion system F family protein [Phycisphaerae bacterium]